MKEALLSEERVYQELAPMLGKWMPRLYATFHVDDWHVLILKSLDFLVCAVFSASN